MTYRFGLRVYYEDTDLAGIVYYANYLKFIERGRSEWVRSIGVDQDRLKRDGGMVFVVRRVDADFLTPARYDDILTVETDVVKLGASTVSLDQRVMRGGDVCFRARVMLALINDAGRPVRIPAELRQKLEGN